MASQKQIAANRRNAAKSTGPKTRKGKSLARMNALKHGLRAEQVVVPGEDPDEFDDLFRRLVEHFQPVGLIEEQLVERIAVCTWRLKRLTLIETGIMHKDWYESIRAWAHKEMAYNFPFFDTRGSEFVGDRVLDFVQGRDETGADPELLSAFRKAKKIHDEARAELDKPVAVLAGIFQSSGTDLDLLARYVTTNDRWLRNAIQDLERAQDRRRSEAAESAMVIDEQTVSPDLGPKGNREAGDAEAANVIDMPMTARKKRPRVRL